MSDKTGMVIPNANPTPEEEPLTKDYRDEKKEPPFEKKTLYQKLCFIKSNITVEPILAGLIIPSMLARLAIQNLNLDKTCRIKLHFGDEVCDALIEKESGNLYRRQELEVQRVISGIEAWKSVIQTAIPTVLVIFMGAWSDRTGNRKVCILLPIVGEICVCVSNIISTYFFEEISVEVTMFLEGFFPAITGGWVLMYLGVFSYISDITDEDSRTFRVGLVNLCMTAGIPIGTSLSGILLKLWGYYAIFAISGTIYLLSFFYGYFYLKTNVRSDNNDLEKKKPITCLDITTLVKETGAVAFKKRSGNQRTKILILLLVVAILYGPGHGERIVFYLYLRYRLNWDAVMYSFYSTYSVITHSFGALFMISVFSKRWGWHDSVLCLISVVSKMIGSVYIAFVQTDLQMFMGKMNSLFSLVETLAALVFDPTYSLIYRKTIGWFAGTIFIFSASLTVPPIMFLVWFFIQHRKEMRQKQIQETARQIEEKQKEVIALTLVAKDPELVDSP